MILIYASREPYFFDCLMKWSDFNVCFCICFTFPLPMYCYACTVHYQGEAHIIAKCEGNYYT